ncbi:hypothetical protein ACFLZV_01635 [Candidatus Margulisiibacteriota bacterium]
MKILPNEIDGLNIFYKIISVIMPNNHDEESDDDSDDDDGSMIKRAPLVVENISSFMKRAPGVKDGDSHNKSEEVEEKPYRMGKLIDQKEPKRAIRLEIGALHYALQQDRKIEYTPRNDTSKKPDGIKTTITYFQSIRWREWRKLFSIKIRQKLNKPRSTTIKLMIYSDKGTNPKEHKSVEFKQLFMIINNEFEKKLKDPKYECTKEDLEDLTLKKAKTELDKFSGQDTIKTNITIKFDPDWTELGGEGTVSECGEKVNKIIFPSANQNFYFDIIFGESYEKKVSEVEAVFEEIICYLKAAERQQVIAKKSLFVLKPFDVSIISSMPSKEKIKNTLDKTEMMRNTNCPIECDAFTLGKFSEMGVVFRFKKFDSNLKSLRNEISKLSDKRKFKIMNLITLQMLIYFNDIKDEGLFCPDDKLENFLILFTDKKVSKKSNRKIEEGPEDKKKKIRSENQRRIKKIKDDYQFRLGVSDFSARDIDAFQKKTDVRFFTQPECQSYPFVCNWHFTELISRMRLIESENHKKDKNDVKWLPDELPLKKMTPKNSTWVLGIMLWELYMGESVLGGYFTEKGGENVDYATKAVEFEHKVVSIFYKDGVVENGEIDKQRFNDYFVNNKPNKDVLAHFRKLRNGLIKQIPDKNVRKRIKHLLGVSSRPHAKKLLKKWYDLKKVPRLMEKSYIRFQKGNGKLNKHSSNNEFKELFKIVWNSKKVPFKLSKK